MDAQRLRDRIATFASWQYEFEFEGGVRTRPFSRAMVNRQRERYRYFFAALLRLTGGSLAGRRVLDLGCNAGFFSLAAAEAGADFVLGVDAQQRYVDQAALVFEAKGIDPARYGFVHANALAHDFHGGFDVVLCLGMLNQLAKPVELFARMADAGAELIVIDTEVSRARLPLFELTRPYNAEELVEGSLALVPSPSAVIELAREFGFGALALQPDIRDHAGMSDYRRLRRLAFICSKGVPLEGLPPARARSLMPWWLRDPGALLSAWR
jgi:SAM-dependent methyltransferase